MSTLSVTHTRKLPTYIVTVGDGEFCIVAETVEEAKAEVKAIYGDDCNCKVRKG